MFILLKIIHKKAFLAPKSKEKLPLNAECINTIAAFLFCLESEFWQYIKKKAMA
jgi:hypothetical protein